MTLKTNLRGQVRQTALPKWKCLLPLFEAMMNSFHAIQERTDEVDHSITVECLRDTILDQPDELASFSTFIVRDTGVGFDNRNFDSFNTAFSEYKIDRGGKGLGRFIWLVAFERVEIDSVFQTSNPASLWRRSFKFDTDYDPDDANALVVNSGDVGTTVKLLGFKSSYKSECPRTVEAISQRLIEHFILVLLQPNCPRIDLLIDGSTHSINSMFRDYYEANATATEFELLKTKFQLHGFKITSPRANKHRLVYAANSRGVLSENLEKFVPNLSRKLPETDGSAFVYLAIVQSPYLDSKVNNSRTDFEIVDEELDDDGSTANQPQFKFGNELSKADIRETCVTIISAELSPYIASLNEAKFEEIERYVSADAPQYKPLLRYKDSFIDRVPPGASKLEIEMALHRELHQREVEIKREGSKMITGAERIEDYETYRTRLSEFIERFSELGTVALAQHVMHRKIIIELLEKAISKNRSDRYPLEQIVHNIIFPMRSTDRDALYSQQNLWIIDERLTFHTYVVSDKPISSYENVTSDSRKRPDIAIFDNKIAFSEPAEDSAPINSLVVIEFKRPQLSGHTNDKNPLTQVFTQIADIRRGATKNLDGRPIRTANEYIPAFAYIVCDVTDSLKEVLRNFDATSTPDGLSYYGYNRNNQVYYEVIDYSKIVSDAKKRNRIFFERLKINN